MHTLTLPHTHTHTHTHTHAHTHYCSRTRLLTSAQDKSVTAPLDLAHLPSDFLSIRERRSKLSAGEAIESAYVIKQEEICGGADVRAQALSANKKFDLPSEFGSGGGMAVRCVTHFRFFQFFLPSHFVVNHHSFSLISLSHPHPAHPSSGIQAAAEEAPAGFPCGGGEVERDGAEGVPCAGKQNAIGGSG